MHWLKQLLCRHHWRHHMLAYTYCGTSMYVECAKCELTDYINI